MDKKRNLLLYLFSQVFFLFNFVGMPIPLAYTNFLSVFGYKHLLNKQSFRIVGTVIVLAGLYALIHFYVGVDILYYLKSSGYYLLLFVSSLLVYKYLKTNRLHLEAVFQFSCVTTFIFFLIGVALYESEFASYLWKVHDFVGTGNVFKRYKGLSYEPSHFALIVSPLVIYAFLNLYKNFSIKNFLLFLAVFVPVLATISFGFVGSFILGFAATITLVYKKYSTIERFFVKLILVGLVGLIGTVTLSEGLRERFIEIFSGHDTSVNGRTYQAFYLGYRCAAEKSILFGAGAGQIKVIGEKVIRPYYTAWDPVGYSKENWPVMAIPNVTAETFAMYGVIGLLLRFGLQLYLFVRMKVYRNYFNLFLFCFMFSYQLLGSFFTSTAEALLWVMCLIPMFPQFDIVSQKKN